jgi:hypothetical protein
MKSKFQVSLEWAVAAVGVMTAGYKLYQSVNGLMEKSQELDDSFDLTPKMAQGVEKVTSIFEFQKEVNHAEG